MRDRLAVHPSRLAVAPRVTGVATEAGTVRVRVEGMVCGLCAMRTEQAFRGLPGVETARADLEAGTVTLTTRGDVTDLEGRLDGALASVVVGGALRRWFERLIHAMRLGARGRG